MLVTTVPVTAFSEEVIRLKNGNTLKGEIISQTDKVLVVLIPGVGTMTLQKAEIASVEPSAPESTSEEATDQQTPKRDISESVGEESVPADSATGIEIPGFSGKSLPLFKSMEQGKLLIPDPWPGFPSDELKRFFGRVRTPDNKHVLMVIVEPLNASQTALEEALYHWQKLEHQAKESSPMTTNLLAPPTEREIEGTTWAYFAEENSWPTKKNGVERVRTEQYYRKGQTAMVGVILYSSTEDFAKFDDEMIASILQTIDFKPSQVQAPAVELAAREPDASAQAEPDEADAKYGARLREKVLKAEPVKVRTFANARGDIVLPLPDEWFIREYKYANPYQVIASPENISKPGDLVQVSISLQKFYHHSYTRPEFAGVVTEEVLNAYVKRWRERNDEFPDQRLSEAKVLTVQGAPARLMEVSFDTPADYREVMYVLYAMKDDVLIRLLLEAPEQEFEHYRPAYDNFIKTAVLFSSEGKPKDHALLDKESSADLISRLNGMRKDDVEGIMEVFDEAFHMNPSYATLHMMFGGWCMTGVANALSPGETQTTWLNTAERSLKQAIELYTQHPEDYGESDQIVHLPQCYFLLGDIYYYPYNRKDEAKKFYEQSVELVKGTPLHDVSPAKKALERYQENERGKDRY